VRSSKRYRSIRPLAIIYVLLNSLVLFRYQALFLALHIILLIRCIFKLLGFHLRQLLSLFAAVSILHYGTILSPRFSTFNLLSPTTDKITFKAVISVVLLVQRPNSPEEIFPNYSTLPTKNHCIVSY